MKVRVEEKLVFQNVEVQSLVLSGHVANAKAGLSFVVDCRAVWIVGLEPLVEVN